MRKVIVSMNVTLDGFMAGSNGELDWHFKTWNEEMAKSFGEQLSKADTILLGRVTYQAMAKYWSVVAMNPSTPKADIPFAELMNNYTKIVFSKTLVKTEWNNTRVIKKNIRSEILKLKQQPGKNMIIYGSGILVASLMQLDVIDEYLLSIHPVVLGKGKPLFKGLHASLNLLNTNKFNSGVITLRYEVRNEFNHYKSSIMNKHFLNDDVKVFYVTASSFPDGVSDAYQKLRVLLPSSKDRKFYGISHGGKNGIVYKAAVEEAYDGEAEKYGCETFIIPRGEYISELLTDWRKDETAVGKTFRNLLANPAIDQDGFCLEEYLNENDVRCMVKLDSSKNN